MTPKLFLLAALLALPTFASAGKSLYFASPSGNIFCMGDSRLEYGNPPVLAYGKTIRGKGWQCTSQTDGMRCQNRSKHGFWLNRSRQTLF